MKKSQTTKLIWRCFILVFKGH